MSARRLIATLGLAMLPAAAFGAYGGDMPAFEAIDRNGDGKLTLAEVRQSDAVSEAFYRKADLGKLTEGDFVSELEYEMQVAEKLYTS